MFWTNSLTKFKVLVKKNYNLFSKQNTKIVDMTISDNKYEGVDDRIQVQEHVVWYRTCVGWVN